MANKKARNAMAATVGDVPRMSTLATFNEDYDDRTAAPPTLRHGPGSPVAKRGNGLNLRAVSEVLLGYGMDPADEIARVLVEQVPVVDARGQPVLDPETGKPATKPAVDRDTRLRVHLELMQYTRPKLKAIEHTIKEPELTDDQIERRLTRLLTKVQEK